MASVRFILSEELNATIADRAGQLGLARSRLVEQLLREALQARKVTISVIRPTLTANQAEALAIMARAGKNGVKASRRNYPDFREVNATSLRALVEKGYAVIRDERGYITDKAEEQRRSEWGKKRSE